MRQYLSTTFLTGVLLITQSVAGADTLPIRGESGQLILGLGGINDFQVSQDGRYIATRGFNHVALWDANTYEIIRVHPVEGDGFWGIEFSPDSQWLLFAHTETSATLWNVDTGNIDQIFNRPKGMITSLAFSPDGRRILIGSYDNPVTLWDVDTGEQIRSFSESALPVLRLSFSNDCAHAFFMDRDNLWIVNLGTGLETPFFDTINESRLVHYTVSPNEQYLLAAFNFHIQLWDMKIKSLIKTWDIRSRGPGDMIFSKDNRYAVVTYNRGTDILTVESGELATNLPVALSTLQWDKDNRIIGNGSFYGIYDPHWIGRVNIENATIEIVLDDVMLEHSSGIIGSRFLNTDQLLTAESYSGLKIWDLNTGQADLLFQWPFRMEEWDLSPDGKQFLTISLEMISDTSRAHVLRMWDYPSRSPLWSQESDVEEAFFRQASFLGDGSIAFTLHDQGKIHFWDTESGVEIKPFSINPSPEIQGLLLSPDKTTFLIRDASRTISIYRVGEKEKFRSYELQQNHFPVAVNNSGEFVCVLNEVSRDYFLIQTADDEIVQTYRLEFTGGSAAFSHDTQLISIGDSIWNTFSGFKLKEYRSVLSGVDLYFSPDRTRMVKSGNAVEIFDLTEFVPVADWFTY